MFEEKITTPTVKIYDSEIDEHRVELYIKREDLTDPYISGNKYRKLKYNLISAKEQGKQILLTFGGAYSNHIHAVAYAGYKFGFKTIGVIRGEEHLPLNPTLKDATYFGMSLYYLSRSEYRDKSSKRIIEQLKTKFGDFYLVPEGGSNALAVKGCTEILNKSEKSFDHICCACGTGGTIAGITVSMNGAKKVWGFPALKNGQFLKEIITKLTKEYNNLAYNNWNLILDYHFGGYAKYDSNLIDFINDFNQKHGIQLDPIYTGKMMYGLYDQIRNGLFRKEEKILAIHTGGLQGITGFNERYGPLIKT